MILPNIHEAPLALTCLPGNCGPLSVWYALKYFKKRASADEIIAITGHNTTLGCFTIGLAIAIVRKGLYASFHTFDDAAIHKKEKPLYQQAAKSGVVMCPPIKASRLRSVIDDDHMAILYIQHGVSGLHFTPAIRHGARNLFLPNTMDRIFTTSDVAKLWTPEKTCMQCIIISKK